MECGKAFEWSGAMQRKHQKTSRLSPSVPSVPSSPSVPESDDTLRRFWQRRYYDFNVYSRAKAKEKLHYMHANPVKEKLVQHPGDWPWSSWCYCYRGKGVLKIDVWL